MTQPASNAMIDYKTSRSFLATNQTIQKAIKNFEKLFWVLLQLFIKSTKTRMAVATKCLKIMSQCLQWSQYYIQCKQCKLQAKTL